MTATHKFPMPTVSVDLTTSAEGPRALTAYMPLISKYDLHLLEICKSAQELSEELARTWLRTFMLKCGEDDPQVGRIVEFFASYDVHKSHGRSIDRTKARELGLNVTNVEGIPELGDLVRSLHNQYQLSLLSQLGFPRPYLGQHPTPSRGIGRLNQGRKRLRMAFSGALRLLPGGPHPGAAIGTALGGNEGLLSGSKITSLKISDLACPTGRFRANLDGSDQLWFDKTPFYKMFEDGRGTNWGRQAQSVVVQLPVPGPPGAPPPATQPGPPQPSE